MKIQGFLNKGMGSMNFYPVTSNTNQRMRILITLKPSGYNNDLLYHVNPPLGFATIM
jgi:hypothetical protein